LGAQTLSRRSLLATAALTVAAGWALAGAPTRRVAAQRAGLLPAELAPPQGATFFGPTSDPATLAAIVLLTDQPGQAVAYLCRGAELNVWFTGNIQDGVLTLTGPGPGEDGTPPPGPTLTEPAPTLRGRLDGDRITGEAELLERTLTFTAIPAEGIAGLYVTERDNAGTVVGASSTGATLRARQAVASGAAAETAPFRITGTVITADGRHVELAIPARTDVPAVFRWVALADGSVRGAGRRRPGAGDQFMGQDNELNRSDDGDRFMGAGIDLNTGAESGADEFVGGSIDL
jgi:hypothetical protein